MDYLCLDMELPVWWPRIWVVMDCATVWEPAVSCMCHTEQHKSIYDAPIKRLVQQKRSSCLVVSAGLRPAVLMLTQNSPEM